MIKVFVESVRIKPEIEKRFVMLQDTQIFIAKDVFEQAGLSGAY